MAEKESAASEQQRVGGTAKVSCVLIYSASHHFAYCGAVLGNSQYQSTKAPENLRIVVLYAEKCTTNDKIMIVMLGILTMKLPALL